MAKAKCTIELMIDTGPGTHGTPITFGESLTFKANVSSLDQRKPMPQGRVTFYCNGVNIGDTARDDWGNYNVTNNPCEPDAPRIKAGIASFLARFEGDDNFDPCDSAIVSKTIERAPTTITADSNILTFTVGTETLTIFSASLGWDDTKVDPGAIHYFNAQEGDVLFYIDGAEVGGCPVTPPYFAKHVVRSVASGDRTLTARYSGGFNHLGADSAGVTVSTPMSTASQKSLPLVNFAFDVQHIKAPGAKDRLNLGGTVIKPGAGLIPGTSSLPGGEGNSVSGSIEFFTIDPNANDLSVSRNTVTSRGTKPLDAQNTASFWLDNLPIGQYWVFGVLKDSTGAIWQISRMHYVLIENRMVQQQSSPSQGTPIGAPGTPTIPGMGDGIPGMGGFGGG